MPLCVLGCVKEEAQHRGGELRAADAAMMVYAPNATVNTSGNADVWGSILARQVTSSGTPRFIYDRALQNQFFTLGNYVMSSFSWKKY